VGRYFVNKRRVWHKRVSIQLVSPASGEKYINWKISEEKKRFHSISFPSEWGDDGTSEFIKGIRLPSFHSISFPSEWGVEIWVWQPTSMAATKFPFN
jgi:hypothetical protein